VEDRGPGQSAVGRLKDTAAGASEVVGGGIPGDAGCRERTAATKGSDQAIFHAFEGGILVLGWLGSLRLGGGLRSRLRILFFGGVFLRRDERGTKKKDGAKQNDAYRRNSDHEFLLSKGNWTGDILNPREVRREETVEV